MSLQSQRDAHDREVEDLIESLVEAVRQPLASAMSTMIAELMALWVQLYGHLDAPADPEQTQPYISRTALLLAALPIVVDRPKLLAGLRKAVRLGVDHAVSEAPGVVRKKRVRLPKEIDKDLRDLPGDMKTPVDEALELLDTIGVHDFGDVLMVTGKANQSLSTLDRRVRTNATTAVTAGATAVIEAAEASRVWVPERDACLECLAYAGKIAKPGELFPGGLSFDKPTSTLPIIGPPRHPNCRCRVSPWLGTTATVGPPAVGGDYPSALRREAERTVLRGGAIGESKRARLRAADALLKTNPALPKTVVARARRAVRKGTFT